MTSTEKARDSTEAAGAAPEELPVSMIDRIAYFELLRPVRADNDNTHPAPVQEQTSACFEAWAMPEYMRH